MAHMELAIIGLGFHVGEFDSVESYLKGLITSKQAFRDRGNYLYHRDKLIEKVTGEALWDANYKKKDKNETAVVLISAGSPEEKLFTSAGDGAKVAGFFALGKVAYNLYDGKYSFFRGVSLAKHLLKEGNVSSVLICVAHPFSSDLRDPSQAEGAAAIILKEKNKAIADHNKIYACINSIVIEDPDPVTDNDGGKAGKGLIAAVKEGGVGAGELHMVDIFASGSVAYERMVTGICRDNLAGLLSSNVFTLTGMDLWLGSGDALAVTAAFVRHALQLFLLRVFVFKTVDAPPLRDEFDNPYTWIKKGEKRVSLIATRGCNLDTSEEYAAYAVFTECNDDMEEFGKCLLKMAPVPVPCTSPVDLQNKLTALLEAVNSLEKESTVPMTADLSLKALWDAQWEKFRETEAAYTAVLLFNSRRSLVEEINRLLDKIGEMSDEGGFIEGSRYESLTGSYFTASPYGSEAKIVYINSSAGMQFLPRFFIMMMLFPYYRREYVRYMDSYEFNTMEGYESRFGVMGIETRMTNIANQIAGKHLGMKPDILTGHSMGEFTSLFAYNSIADRVYEDPQDRVIHDEALLELLVGARDCFSYRPKDDYISTYLTGPANEVLRFIEREEEVYPLIISSPRSVFVSGKKDAVERIVKEGGFLSFPKDYVYFVHSPYVAHFEKIIYDATMKCKSTIRPDLDYEIYGCYHREAIGDTVESLAKYSSVVLTKPCDFCSLAELIYEKGGRVFVDMGTGGSCVDWVNEIFVDRSTLNLSIYPSLIDARDGLIRVFSKLLAYQVRFDYDTFLSSFAFPFMEQTRPAGELNLTPAAESVVRPAEGRRIGVPAPVGQEFHLAEQARPAGELNLTQATESAVHPADAVMIGVPAPSEPELHRRTRSGALVFQQQPANVEPRSESQPSVGSGFQSRLYDVHIPAIRDGEDIASELCYRSFYRNAWAYGLFLENERLLLETAYSSAQLSDTRKQTQAKGKKTSPAPEAKKTNPAPEAKKTSPVLWDEEQLLEITAGSPAKVWGDRYTPLDALTKRARMPLPPFLFVSRITGIDAEFGRLRPSSIDMELDVTGECVFMTSEGTMSSAFLCESSHVIIVLLSYMGTDLIYDGKLCYRLLNSKTALYGRIPVPGDTIQGHLELQEFIKSGSTTLIKSSFFCYNRGQHIMTLEMMGGFFTEEELSKKNNAKSILPVDKRVPREKSLSLSRFEPRREQVLDMTGFYDGVYGPNICPFPGSPNEAPFYIKPLVRMIDRIVSFDLSGGVYGLGVVTAEKELDENHWVFDVHFLNDPVFPGALLIEAASQIQLLFAMNAGFLNNGRYTLGGELGAGGNCMFRGQITPEKSVLRFEQNIKEILEIDNQIIVVSDCDGYWQGNHILRAENITLSIEEA